MIKIHISIEADTALSDTEKAVLAALAGIKAERAAADPDPMATAMSQNGGSPATVREEQATDGEAEQGTAWQTAQAAEDKPKRTRRTKAEMEAARAAEAAMDALTKPGDRIEPEEAPAGDVDGRIENQTYGEEAAAVESEISAAEAEVEPEEAPIPAGVFADAALDDAVKLATTMVSQGRTGDIKEFLQSVNVKRVSELKGDAINAFVAKFS